MENNDNNEYQFIKEKIVKTNKGRGKKAALVFVSVVASAFVFGIVARFAFVLSAEMVNKILGVEEDTPVLKEEVVLAGDRNFVTPSVTDIPESNEPDKDETVLPDDEDENEDNSEASGDDNENVTIIEKKIIHGE